MHSIIGYYKEELGTHTFLERASHANVRAICMYHSPAFLRKWEVVGGWPLFHSTPSHSFLCLEPAAKSGWLWAVSCGLPHGRDGMFLWPVSAPLSVVLRAETHRDRERGRDGTRAGAGGGGHTGAALGGALPSWGVLRKATPCLVHFWEGRKKKAVCKNTTLKFKIFKK